MRRRFFAAQDDVAEAFEFVEETFHEMALLVKRPVGWPVLATDPGALGVGDCARRVRDERAQMIRVMGRIRHHMPDAHPPPRKRPIACP